MDKIIKTKKAWNYWLVTVQVIKQVQKSSFISYVLPEQIQCYNIKGFLSYFKN